MGERNDDNDSSAMLRGAKHGRAIVVVVLLILAFLISGFCGVSLFLDEKWNMLLAEAELTPTRQYLGVGGWLPAGITASHVCFDGFHT